MKVSEMSVKGEWEGEPFRESHVSFKLGQILLFLSRQEF